MKWCLLTKSWESELLPYLNMKVWHIGLNPKQKVQLTFLHHRVLQVKIIFRLNFLNLLCLLALIIHELLVLGSKKLRFNYNRRLLRVMSSNGVALENKTILTPPPPPPLHSKLGCLLSSTGSLNSRPTLHEGVGEEKLYFPFLSWQNVREAH